MTERTKRVIVVCPTCGRIVRETEIPAKYRRTRALMELCSDICERRFPEALKRLENT